MLSGIDISDWQPADQDMTGHDIVIIKATEGYRVRNSRMAAQVAKARAEGRRVGFYHFSWVMQDPGLEAAHFYQVVAPVLQPGDTLWLDWEWSTAQEKPANGGPVRWDTARAYKDAWFLEARRLFGPAPRIGLYTNQYRWVAVDMNGNCGDDNALWVAHYGVPAGQPAVKHPWVGHQWTEYGGPAGARLDVNVWAFPDLAAYDRWARRTPAPIPPTPQEKPVPLSVTKRVTWRGVVVDERTAAMLTELARITPALPTITPTQGSFRPSTSYSAGTHTGAGAIDLSVLNLTAAQQTEVINWARAVGFAAWIRPFIKNLWPRHIHMIAVPPSGSLRNDGNLGADAFDQVIDYYAGRDGLASRGKDPHTRAHVGVTWEIYATRLQREDWLTMATEAQVKAIVKTAVEEALWGPLMPGADQGDPNSASIRQNLASTRDRAEAGLVILRELAARQGIDIDEAALARELVESVTPLVRDIVTQTLAEPITEGEHPTPESIADAVVARLGAQLTTRQA